MNEISDQSIACRLLHVDILNKCDDPTGICSFICDLYNWKKAENVSLNSSGKATFDTNCSERNFLIS